MAELAELAFWTAILASGVRLALSVAMAAIGEMITERAGVLNLGLEGTMIIGAFFGFAAAWRTGSVPVGLAAGFVAGCVVGGAFAALVVGLRVDQVVAGLSFTLVGLALTSFLNTELFRDQPIPPRSPLPEPLAVPVLENLPLVGEGLFRQTWVAYAAAALVAVLAVWLKRSYQTIVLDAAGETPEAADAAGHSISGVRYRATIVGSGLAGLGGALLVVGQLGFFNSNITAGRGWIALALVIFGRWRPGWIVAGAVFFGALDALQFRFQSLDSSVPYEFFLALPYLVTLAALAVGRRRVNAPSALGVPYQRSTEA